MSVKKWPLQSWSLLSQLGMSQYQNLCSQYFWCCWARALLELLGSFCAHILPIHRPHNIDHVFCRRSMMFNSIVCPCRRAKHSKSRGSKWACVWKSTLDWPRRCTIDDPYLHQILFRTLVTEHAAENIHSCTIRAHSVWNNTQHVSRVYPGEISCEMRAPNDRRE